MAVMQKREDLEDLIEKAIKKISGKKEKDLCKYIPGPNGGYMHHFTLRKLKKFEPEKTMALIQQWILETDAPHVLNPKQRAPRGSRKKNDLIHFTRNDLEKVLDLARKAGDKDLIERFSPKRSLPALKRDLIKSIKENKVHQDLWNAFAEVLTLTSLKSN